MRHAKSSRENSDLQDFDRPLNKRGRADAPRMGNYLKEIGTVPDQVVSSPAERAKETVLLLADALGLDESAILWNQDLYFKGVDAYLESIKQFSNQSDTALIAGHNPSIEQLAGRLSGGGSVRITTGNIACFESDEGEWADVRSETTRFKWLVRPRDLK